MRELCVGKLACTVLEGAEGGDTLGLPSKFPDIYRESSTRGRSNE
jgi:hypothetical protein